jgi:hypothetical protein
VVQMVGFFRCHCEERSDEATSCREVSADRDCFALLAVTGFPEKDRLSESEQ